MTTSEVSIVRLEPMRVASVYAFGPNPEKAAWDKMIAWEKGKGFFDDPEKHPVFGFNNPNPRFGSRNYGYELWMKLKNSIEPEGDMRIVEFGGGPYAVMRCKVLGEPYKNIPPAWQFLVEWCKGHNKAFGYHQALEKYITRGDDQNALILELYAPIIE